MTSLPLKRHHPRSSRHHCSPGYCSNCLTHPSPALTLRSLFSAWSQTHILFTKWKTRSDQPLLWNGPTSVTLRVESKLPTMSYKALFQTHWSFFFFCSPSQTSSSFLPRVLSAITMPHAWDNLSWNSLFLGPCHLSLCLEVTSSRNSSLTRLPGVILPFGHSLFRFIFFRAVITLVNVICSCVTCLPL